MDETYVKVAGRWRNLYRAVDQFGQIIDLLLSEQRDTAAARRFFTRALRHGPAPVVVTTDKAGPYLRVLDELVPAAAHATEQYANPNQFEIERLLHSGEPTHEQQTTVLPLLAGRCRRARYHRTMPHLGV